MKIECLALILAGGQGSRLGVLTKSVAKPAVMFGGKYRIIDFPLSNCANSGITRVGVLTQYRPLELNNYLGTGGAWDLDRHDGGVFILPPYAREKEAEWYSGTADAVYQNTEFIEMSDPEYVLILSGDHIYTMDYSKMLDSHIANGAEATIGVFKVPWEEASRFGIMNIDESGRIIEFEEKPPQPKSNLASMGIYIFNKDFLLKYLRDDADLESSSHDFGKDVIPKMLADGAKMFSHTHEGYWKDVGTIESLWQANMDMLEDEPAIDPDGPWQMYSNSPSMPPHYVGREAKVSRAIVSEGVQILGSVINSVVFSGVRVARNSQVVRSVIMPDVKVGEGARVEYAIMASRAVVEPGAVVQGEPGKIAVVAEGEVVRADGGQNLGEETP